MGSSKKKKGTPYVDYFISMHYGVCHGPIDELVDIVVKEKSVLDEGQTFVTEANFSVDKPDLFGGSLREGGFVGQVHWLPGTSDQSCPPALAERLGDVPDNLPGFRDYGSIFFYGNQGSGARGFEVGSNIASVPPIWLRVRRASRQLATNQPILYRDGYYHSNPMSIIYECLTDAVWGMSGSPNLVNVPNFTAVAQVLAEENFGLTLTWTRQQSIEDFVQIILNHINGCLYYNPYVGKMEVKLFRKDYDVDELEEIGPDNAELRSFRRPLWGETVNEIIVKWTDPKTKEMNSVTYQDLANIAMQGQVVSQTNEYPGIRNEELAGIVCARDLASSSTPLATASIRVNRRKVKLLPGQVFKFTWPKDGYDIGMVVMRVIDVDWGTPDNSWITISAIEDIFGTPLATYMEPEPPAWEPPGKDPDSPIFETMEMLFRSIPYSMLAPLAADGEAELSDDLYNQIVIGTFLLPRADQPDIKSYELYRPGVNSGGEAAYDFLGEMWPTGHLKLIEDIPQAVESVITLPEPTGGPWPREGAIGMLLQPSGQRISYSYSPGYAEHYEEMILFQEYLGDGKWRVLRGLMDTVPLPWKVNDRMVIITDSYNGYDTSERFADQVEQFRFKIRTSLGISTQDFDRVTSRVDRPYRPYRPANVRVGVTMFGVEDQSQNTPQTPVWIDDDHVPRQWQINITWSHRNRKMEDNVFMRWDAASVPPEDGQTTEVIVMDRGYIVERISGLTGTSYTLNIEATTARLERLTIKVVSRRNGLESLQGIEIGLYLYIKGFGSDWGYMWGGWPENPYLTDIDAAIDLPFMDKGA